MTSISLDAEAGKVRKGATCHLLPCKISSSGPCGVSEYFTPHIRKEEDHVTCSLRGRPLCGRIVRVPEGYSGVVLRDNKVLGLGTRELRPTASFQELTAWGWDSFGDDKLRKALQWTQVAEALHRPVGEHEAGRLKSNQVKRKLSAD